MRARATVLFDADRLTAGPGRTGPADYLAVPVVCQGGGAFHPKLLVIASESDAAVAIGSGKDAPDNNPVIGVGAGSLCGGGG